MFNYIFYISILDAVFIVCFVISYIDNYFIAIKQLLSSSYQNQTVKKQQQKTNITIKHETYETFSICLNFKYFLRTNHFFC